MGRSRKSIAKPAAKAPAPTKATKPSPSQQPRAFAARHDDGHGAESDTDPMAQPVQTRLMDMPVHSPETEINLQRSPAANQKEAENNPLAKEKLEKEVSPNTVPPKRYGVELVPPLRDPAKEIPPPLNLDLPQSYQTMNLNEPNLPDWFWKELPAKPVQESLLKQLSRWSTQKLGRRELARIGGYLSSKLGFDEKKMTKCLDDAMVSGGEAGLKELLKIMLEALAGSPNKRKGVDPTDPSYPEFQTPSPELPTPFILNSPKIKF